MEIDMSIGFYRQGAPRLLSREEAARLIRPVAFAAIEALVGPHDPFTLDDVCPNPGGHQPIMSAGDLVCPHCQKVFW